MKALSSLKHVKDRLNAHVATLALAPVVALQASPVWAELPELPVPDEAIGGGAIADGDWLGVIGGWFKAGLTIFALVICAWGFVQAAMGAVGQWRMYSTGRSEMSDVFQYIVMAAVFAVFIVVLATYALSVLE